MQLFSQKFVGHLLGAQSGLTEREVNIFIGAYLALTGMTTGGIYLGGGICPKILPKLKDTGFMKAFTAKGRFEEFLSGIPVQVILNENAALLGAACYALDLLDK